MFAFIGLLIGWIWDGLQATYDVIVTGLLLAYHAIVAFGSAVWSAAKWTWTNVLKPIVKVLDTYRKWLVEFYHNVIQPIQDWLTKISKLLRTIYNTYFAPVLATIDAVRKTVQLLELLHVGWAAKLDAYLLELEQKISKPILEAIQFVNALDSRIDQYVLTVEHLFQRVTLLASIKRDLAPITNLHWADGLRNVKARLAVIAKGPQFVGEAPAPLDVKAEGARVFSDPQPPDVDELRAYFVAGLPV